MREKLKETYLFTQKFTIRFCLDIFYCNLSCFQFVTQQRKQEIKLSGWVLDIGCAHVHKLILLYSSFYRVCQFIPPKLTHLGLTGDFKPSMAANSQITPAPSITGRQESSPNVGISGVNLIRESPFTWKGWLSMNIDDIMIESLGIGLSGVGMTLRPGDDS